ncbi:hypothetical protein T484DRAFT_1919643, partial [Baffinella frigidus]
MADAYEYEPMEGYDPELALGVDNTYQELGDAFFFRPSPSPAALRDYTENLDDAEHYLEPSSPEHDRASLFLPAVTGDVEKFDDNQHGEHLEIQDAHPERKEWYPADWNDGLDEAEQESQASKRQRLDNPRTSENTLSLPSLSPCPLSPRSLPMPGPLLYP